MKTILKFGLVSVIAMTVLVSSCGKYEEGPKISLMTKKSRIVNSWKLVKEIYNGVEQNLAGFTMVMDIKKDGSYTATITSGAFSFSDTGTWQFSSDKESVITTPAGGSSASTATILRLKSKEFWTKEVNGGNTDEVHYEQN